MLPGETIGSGAPNTCCGEVLKLQVLKTCGYYVGTFCPHCGPYSRETVYIKTREKAESVMEMMLKNDPGALAWMR